MNAKQVIAVAPESIPFSQTEVRELVLNGEAEAYLEVFTSSTY